MRKSFLSLMAGTLGLAFVASASMIDVARAGQKCDTSHNVCAAFWKQMYESEVGGEVVIKKRKRVVVSTTVSVRKKVTTSSGDTVCFHAKVRSGSQSALVMYGGGYNARESATVIKTWGNSGWEGSYKKLCMKASLLIKAIASYGKVTICGLDGHNTLRANDLKTILRAGTVGKDDPAELYGSGGAHWL